MKRAILSLPEPASPDNRTGALNLELTRTKLRISSAEGLEPTRDQQFLGFIAAAPLEYF